MGRRSVRSGSPPSSNAARGGNNIVSSLQTSLTSAQLDSLRATIPSIVSPLTRSVGDKALLSGEIRKAAIHSNSGLEAFRAQWTSAETRDLLKKGKESLQKDADLSKAADVSRWGWRVEEDNEK